MKLEQALAIVQTVVATAGDPVAVFVAVLSQFISDVGYTYLNPRIRFA